jgi:shikimate kinase
MLGESPTLEQIKELYAQRLSQYASADLVIEVERHSDREVIDEIVGWVRETQRDG